MKDINIAKTLIIKRKEKGITQDELAAYIGVSKASVSKWETGQSYPDITFLPQLAAYFNISVDELICYTPQMTKEDIKKLYYRLAGEFSGNPFDEVLKECHDIIKKYYSCFPLLLQMAVLFANHHMLAKEKDEQEAILREAMELCQRIKTEGDDVQLTNAANSLEAFCCLVLQKPEEVLELLDGILKPSSSDYTILASAYHMKGNIQKAKEVLQVGMYRYLLDMIDIAPSYLLLHVDAPDKFEDILQRTISIADTYNLNMLNPGIMLRVYLAAAQGYVSQNNNDRALDMIGKYADISTSDTLSFMLHGDKFFDNIDKWFTEFDLGGQAPRDKKIINASIIQAIKENPVFAAITDHPRYKSIIKTMETKLGGK